MTAKKKTYSYIRYPYSKNGWYGFGLALAAFLATQFIVYRSVAKLGDVSPALAALGVTAIIIDIVSMFYTVRGFKEKEKNHLFAVIAAVMAVGVLAEWIFILK